MLIFLDFDGVLHPQTCGSASTFSRRSLLWEILRSCPDVQVVFSTSWKVFHAFDELLEFVTVGGGEDLSSRFIGNTPNIKVNTYYGQRDLEIRCWLTANSNYAGDWIAIDDAPELFFHETEEITELPSLYVVDGKTGLTEKDVTNLTARLKRAS